MSTWALSDAKMPRFSAPLCSSAVPSWGPSWDCSSVLWRRRRWRSRSGQSTGAEPGSGEHE